MPVRDVKAGGRVMYDDNVCEVLRVETPASSPVSALVAIVIDTPAGPRYGRRAWATKAELDAVPEGKVAKPATPAPAPATAADEWGDSLPSNVVSLLEAESVTKAGALELGEAGLKAIKGIGKATAAKILAAAKG